MKRRPKHIEPPQLVAAKKLTPMDLNKIKINRQHTPLTPDMLERLAGESAT